MLDDFENVLAALIAFKNNENDNYIQKCKEAERKNIQKPNTPETIIDKLQIIWNEVFPHRQIRLKDSKFYGVLIRNGVEDEYSATQMSDGERSVLYLVAQVLCVPENKVLVIDEPELHLHRSIMNRLWVTLERYRQDCLYIYITHDTEFAAMHNHADKIWVREFDGINWKLERLSDHNLPEDLLLNIMGSRKNVLFVEGEKNSYDTKLYTVLYPSYQVVACGSCTQVIARTKAFKNNASLHHCDVFGIIDRDFRSEHEIAEYKEDNIYTIDVAEVENLFITEELIKFTASYLGLDSAKIFSEVRKYVVEQRFANQINGQICKSVVSEIKYRLMVAAVSQKNEAEAKASLEASLNAIDYEAIKVVQETKFRETLKSGNYAEIIKVFNEKGISSSVGHFFGLQDATFCSMIVALLHGEKREEIIKLLEKYLPTEIPR